MNLLTFLGGVFVGGIFGVFLMCLAAIVRE